jgi:hypothetical protein
VVPHQVASKAIKTTKMSNSEGVLICMQPKQVGLLFEFIAKYFARGVVDVPHYILQRVLAYLVLSTDSSSVRERERLLLEILHSSAPPARLQYDRLLILAENARLFVDRMLSAY